VEADVVVADGGLGRVLVRVHRRAGAIAKYDC